MFRKIIVNGKVVGFERVNTRQATRNEIGFYCRRVGLRSVTTMRAA